MMIAINLLIKLLSTPALIELIIKLLDLLVKKNDNDVDEKVKEDVKKIIFTKARKV